MVLKLIDGFKIITSRLEEIAKLDIEKEERETGEIDERGREFLSNYLKGYNVFELEPGDEISNKIFFRRNNEINHNDFVISELTEKIDITELKKYNICNSEYNLIPELPDLFSRIDQPIGEESDKIIISLENIISYYKKFGVKKLIIFDFSCSIFSYDEDNNNYGLNEDEIKFVRELMKDELYYKKFNRLPYGGKYKSRKNKLIKNKSRKKLKINKSTKYKSKKNINQENINN